MYKLNKALYGLKQAPRAWYSKIDSYFGEQGYKRSPNEPTLYVKKTQTGDIIYVCLYVDDIICTSSCHDLITEFKQGMKQAFEMTDMGLLKLFLGLEINQTKKGIFLHQHAYAKNLLHRFGIIGKAEPTPMNCNEKLSMQDEAEKADEETFRSMVGGLIYLTHSRPDLAHAVSVVSRFMQRPSKVHFDATRRILKYVAGTIDFGIWYTKTKEFALTGYSDSDWASNVDDRKSLSAYMFSLGSGAVSWSSKKQQTVALSSTEAEYIAATGATCQAIWLRRVLEDLGLKQEAPTVIYCDNKSAISLSKNPMHHSRAKHIELRFHFIREMVEQKQVSLEFCSTHEQIADVLTKSVTKEKFVFFRWQLGVMQFESRGHEEE